MLEVAEQWVLHRPLDIQSLLRGNHSSGRYRSELEIMCPEQLPLLRMACDKEPLLDNLQHRGLHPPRCPLCDQQPKTLQHLLLGCVVAREVWVKVYGAGGMKIG